MFMVSLNTTVVAPALGIIATDLNAEENQTWIATSYLVAVNAFQPLKFIFLTSIALFFIGSLLNALSINIGMLIAGRTIQGLGGGGILAISFVIVTDKSPLRFRARIQSLLSITYGVASVVGPLIGGVFVDNVSWHWDFWINIIFGVISFALVLVFFRDSKNDSKLSFSKKIKKVDWLGSLFSTSSVVCLLLALAWGSNYGWDNAHSIGTFVVSGVSLIMLVYVEGWVAKDPILPRSVLLNINCAMAYLYTLFLGLCFACALYFGPIYFQGVFAANSTQSGIRLVPYMICLIASAGGSGILIRRFPYLNYYIAVGAASNVICFGLYHLITENSSWGQQAGFLTFGGFAFGLSAQNLILMAQSTVDHKDLAVATTCAQFFLTLSCSVGVSVYQTLVTTFAKAQYTALPPQIILQASKYGALKNYLFIKNLPIEIQKPVVHAFASAMRNLFIVPAVASGISLIVALCFRNVPYEVSKANLAAKDEESVAGPEKA
ncbi:major facilitator superfamily domain-containing protein [Sporodiniella umbellata]|nr:major facilitator superfamily domain-containing protein [Sporodiniella umbellata]